MNICVFGAASDKISSSYIESVERLGEIIAENGHSLVFGAGRDGLMGAVARGVKRKNGSILGIVPSFFIEENIEAMFDSCTQLIQTETMRERKSLMESMANAFVVVPGGIGTFEEFFEIVTLKQLGRHKKPIIIYNINGYYDSMQEMMEVSMREGFVREKCSSLYEITDDVDKIIDLIENTSDFKLGVEELKRN